MNRRQQRRGMQDFRSEIRQFGGFIEADALDGLGVGTEARVGGHHAFDVGPDFDAGGVKRGADNGGGIVRPASAERGGNASGSGGDESTHHRNAFLRK